jgi:hypothetical protein
LLFVLLLGRLLVDIFLSSWLTTKALRRSSTLCDDF